MAKKFKNKNKGLGVIIEDTDNAAQLMAEAMAEISQKARDELAALTGDRTDETEKKPAAAARKKKPSPPFAIDLHGMTLLEAKLAIESTVSRQLLQHAEICLEIITGKGLHSGQSGGVLFSEIHRFMLERYRSQIKKIDASPADSMIGGKPIRGSFRVWLKRLTLA